jgi:hypothetical protein
MKVTPIAFSLAMLNVLSTLLAALRSILRSRADRGTLVAAAPVFDELIAAPGRSETFVGTFFEETGIGVDWELTEQYGA